MKYTHIVVKAGNGKPDKDQIDSAAMVRNAGQTFALIHTFKEDAKGAVLIDAAQAKKIEKHQESHGFEIHELPEPETGEPVKPGDKINESELDGESELGDESKVTKNLNSIAILVESIQHLDDPYAVEVSKLLRDELELAGILV